MSVDTGIIMQLVGDLGSLGFILYLVHRTTTHTIPRLAAEYMASEQRQREDFKLILSEQRGDFLGALDRERQIQTGQTDRIIQAIRDMRE